MIHDKQSGHIGGSFSLAEVVSYLYNNYNLVEDNKDKLILSKGHAVPILYAALYEMGLIDTLDDFREVNSQLQGHPDKTRLKYMHATTGALGQGLSIGIGHALAYRLKCFVFWVMVRSRRDRYGKHLCWHRSTTSITFIASLTITSLRMMGLSKIF